MEIVECSKIVDFGGSIRRYYNIQDIRILDVSHHSQEEQWHRHNEITEVLFILEGLVRVQVKDESGEIKKDVLVNPDEVVVFKPKEWHLVLPRTPKTRIIVIKYLYSGMNLLPTFIKDWEGE